MVEAGEPTRLAWRTEGAVAIRLFENGSEREGEEFPPQGSWEVTPEGDSTYRLEALGRDDRWVGAEVEVRVEEGGVAPRIESFLATPEVVESGEPVTLSWKVIGAEVVEIVDAEGEGIATFSPAEEEGDHTVLPTESTRYVLVATGEGGRDEAEVEVQVRELPKIALSLSKNEATYGDEVELSWTVTSAETLQIVDPSGETIYDGPAENDSLEVRAERSGSFLATAKGPGGEESARVDLGVRPWIESFVLVAPADAPSESLGRLYWKVHGAESIVVLRGSEELFETAEGEGEEEVMLVDGESFLLRAHAGALLSEATATREILEPPTILGLTAGLPVTAGQGVSGRSTIAWVTEGASWLVLELLPGGQIDVSEKDPAADEIEVEFFEAGMVRLIAGNDAGTAVESIPAPVEPVPTIETFFAAPSRAGMGEFVGLFWETSDAYQITIERDGQELEIDPHLVSGSQASQPITATTTFLLRARNALDHEVVSDPLTVEVGPPNQVHFDTADGLRIYPAGTTVDLAWENDGGTALTVKDVAANQLLCTQSLLAEIREGGCTITLPNEHREVPLLIEISNASGSDSQPLTLFAQKGPIILDFSADEAAITEGESVLFSWEILADIDETIPTLELEDDADNTYLMTDVVGPAALQGSKSFPVPGGEVGERIFTLTASGDVPPPDVRTTKVVVHARPTIDAMEATPPFAEEAGDEVAFAWSTSHAETVELYGLAENGSVAGTPFFTTADPTDALDCEVGPSPEILECSTSFQPTIAQPHIRVVAKNALGHETTADHRIGLAPATVTSFKANGVAAPGVLDVFMGDEITLEWTTERADAAHLQEGFIDISQRPNAVERSFLSSSAIAVETLPFPGGFSFPAQGQDFTAARIGRSGFLSFDLTATGNATNAVLPSTSQNTRRYDLLPFWDGLLGGTVWRELVHADLSHLIIQWTGMDFSAGSGKPGDLTFQVVLYEDGSFEYRYGEMKGSAGHERGASATIAAQDLAGIRARTLLYNEAAAAPLDGKVFRFQDANEYLASASTPLVTPLSGSHSFRATTGGVFRLSAENGHSQHSEEIEIRVHPRRGRLTVWADPAEPLPGEQVSLHWESENLTSLTIEQGGVVWHEVDPGALAAGSRSLVVTQGIHTFDFQAVGEAAHDHFSQELVVSAMGAFSLESFDASRTHIRAVDVPITLSWESVGAVSGTITELPSGAVYEIPPGDLDEGEHAVFPTRSSTYRLDLESHGRHRSAEIDIRVRTAWVEDFSASALLVEEGETTTLNWSTDGDGLITLHPLDEPVDPMVEVTATSPYVSIANVGEPLVRIGTTTSARYEVVFPEDFSFPWFGKEFREGLLMSDGYFTFDTTESTSSPTRFAFPSEISAHSFRTFALFWADLDSKDTGRAYAHFVRDPLDWKKDHLILEWKNWQFQTVARNGPAPHLNFQLVLFRDGAFEYRYGPMSAATADDAAGAVTTTGFQSHWADVGHTLTHDAALPGGLQNRSWRWQPPTLPPSGSRVVEPGKHTLCVADAAWKECEELYVNALRPGSLLISEIMVDPVGGADHQWFEVINVTPGAIDLEGMTIRMGASSHIIQSGGPFVLGPQEIAVFARQNHPQLGANYVYGTGLEMLLPDGDVSVEWEGLTLAKADWDASWGIPTGASYELSPKELRGDTVSWTNPSIYSPAMDPYDGTNLGTPGIAGIVDTPDYVVDTISLKPFIDIYRTGGVLGSLTADDAVAGVPLDLRVPFFDGWIDRIWADSNGWVSFAPTMPASVAASPSSLPRSAGALPPGPMVSVFWDDMGCEQTPRSFFVLYDQREVEGELVTIVQWNNLRQCSHPGSTTFQVQLWSGGDIVIAFDEIVAGPATAARHRYAGNTAWMAIEPTDRTDHVTAHLRRPQVFSGRSYYFQKK